MGQGLIQEEPGTSAIDIDGRLAEGATDAPGPGAAVGAGTTATRGGRGPSPVLQQYQRAKAEQPQAILLFRLGDFFETFQEDAEVASAILGITLTSRDFGRAGRHPMAGFPAHAAEGYIAKLLAAGRSVAVCDQVEEASAAKGLVRREIVRVLTPGTLVEGALLDPSRENPLVALAWDESTIGIAVLEVSTGRVELTEIPAGGLEILSDAISRISPSEVLVPEAGETAVQAWRPVNARWTVARLEDWRFEAGRGRLRALDVLGVANLAGFDCDDLAPALGALGAALDYLDRNHVSLLAEVIRLRRARVGERMHLDAPTVANLELTEALGGGGRGLLDLIDRTRTPMGARRLRGWVLAPLVDVAAIDERLVAVEALAADTDLRAALTTELRRVRDLERLTTRTVQQRSTPRDLGAIRDSLPALQRVRDLLGAAPARRLGMDRDRIEVEDDLERLLAGALEADLPVNTADGGIIRPGFDDRLDELRHAIREAQDWIAGLEQVERDGTGIRGLKVGFNRVFGYYLEVSNANRLPLPEGYVRKQTLAGAERYITPELKERESIVLNGEQAIFTREREVFGEVCAAVARRATKLLQSADAIADLDALLSLALAGIEHRWVRPEVDDGFGIAVTSGRHPLVEEALGPGSFVANDVDLAEDHRLVLLTGPNMAGKSTYLRQAGLLVLLAQVGSFVPATAARIGVVDRIFTRVGAQDSIASGMSTFMVEMVETANILNHATPRSLVVIDEIGRGTSTYDGMSIAQAVVEQLHDSPRLGCKVLFATHFHELTALANSLPAMRNCRVEVSEEGGKVTFLHRIVAGGADRSYGIHVAEIAGLPAGVTTRAREVLAMLEQARPLRDAGRPVNADQLSLPIASRHPVMARLEELDIENMSPLDALNRLADLKDLVES
jgi:DNA mismatch repair protein MutS